MEMLLTGDLISSEKAYRIGLVNEVLDSEKLKDFVENQALKISKKSSMTLKIGKEAFLQTNKYEFARCVRLRIRNNG